MFTAISDSDSRRAVTANAIGDANWEANTYPTASAGTHTWMRQQRGLIRDFLASDLGSYGLPRTRSDARGSLKTMERPT